MSLDDDVEAEPAAEAAGGSEDLTEAGAEEASTPVGGTESDTPVFAEISDNGEAGVIEA